MFNDPNELRQLVESSGLFDPEYYLLTNDDLAECENDPLGHFLQVGIAENRRPSGLFDPIAYLRLNPDVEASGSNPFLHYVFHGRKENRATGISETLASRVGAGVSSRESVGESLDAVRYSANPISQLSSVLEALLARASQIGSFDKPWKNDLEDALLDIRRDIELLRTQLGSIQTDVKALANRQKILMENKRPSSV